MEMVLDDDIKEIYDSLSQSIEKLFGKTVLLLDNQIISI